MILRKLTASDFDDYFRVNKFLQEESRGDLPPDLCAPMFRALQVEAELSAFMKRNRLHRRDVTVVVNATTKRAYLHWIQSPAALSARASGRKILPPGGL